MSIFDSKFLFPIRSTDTSNVSFKVRTFLASLTRAHTLYYKRVLMSSQCVTTDIVFLVTGEA